MSVSAKRWLACVWVVLSSQVVAADSSWRTASTPHYRVLSQLNDRDTADWMRGFDQFILSTSDVLHMSLRALPPLTVVIFNRDKDYAPYKLQRPNGLSANVAGQFVREPTWSMIGMAYDAETPELRRTLQHEATHWLMSVDQARQPAWFIEGIAEMFSTFERRGDKVNWAKPIGSHLSTLRAGAVEPLAQFLVEPSALFDRDDHTDRFYAQAWAFTDFMMLSRDPTRRELLFKFLQSFRERSGEATVEAVFGPQLKDVERDFHLFIEQRAFPYMDQPVKPAEEPPALQPAPAPFVQASLGFLALGAQHYELARQHAQKAIELDGTAPDGYAVLAYLALSDHNFEEAATQAQAALQRGSKDSELFVLLGDSYVNGANATKPDAAKTRVNMYEDAINLNPRQLASYVRLSEALSAVEEPREEDAKFLEVGLRAFPGEDELRVGAALVDYRLGHHEAAMAALDNVLRPQSTLDGSQRSYAVGLRRSWLIDTMRSEVDVATNSNDFAGARQVIARYRDRIGKDDADGVSYLDQLDSGLAVQELMARYQAAVCAKRKADAHSVAEQLLGRPDLPANLRSYFQQRLRDP